MQSQAKTVAEYIAEVPSDRREPLLKVRDVVLASLDKGFEEGMQYGHIGYYVPHSIFPAGYHCDPKEPLPFIGLASQKNHMSLYIMSLYGNDQQEAEFRKAWAATGKKLDMGKCCIRFKKLEDLALDVIGQSIKRIRLPEYIRYYEQSLVENQQRREDRKAAKQSAPKSSSKSASKKRPSVQKATKKLASKKLASKKVASKKAASKKAAKVGPSPAKRATKKRAAKR